MIKRAIALLLILLLICMAIMGCNKKESSVFEASNTTIETAPPLLDVDISGLLTSEQVGKALGVTVRDAQVIEQSTAVRYSSKDMITYAEICLLKCGRDKFNETGNLYADAVDTANLGRAAKWSAGNSELLVYSGTYMISVKVAVKNKTSDEQLVSARQIAALILEKL